MLKKSSQLVSKLRIGYFYGEIKNIPMKNTLVQLLTIFVLLIITNSLSAQTFNNEWIDYYDKTYLKVQVNEDGVYRIPFDLINENFPNNDPSGFKLINNGKETPIYLSSNNELTDDDYIEFIGYKNDGNFDTQLYKNPDWQLNNKTSLFTDDNTYYLTWDDSDQNLRFNSIENLANGATAETHFTKTNTVILDQEFFDGVPDTRIFAGFNTYYSHFGKNEGFLSTIVIPESSRNFNIETKNIYNNSGTVSLEVTLVGRSNDLFVTNGDHHTALKLNDYELEDVYFEGYNKTTAVFEVPVNVLSETNTLTITSVADVVNEEAYNDQLNNGFNIYPNFPVANDRISISEISISYPHNVNFSGEENYSIDLEDSNLKYLKINPINANSQKLIAYDLTYLEKYEVDNQNDKFQLYLEDKNNNSNRDLILYDPDDSNAFKLVESIEVVEFNDYTKESEQGDYIIITHPFLQNSTDDQVQRYADYRASEAGGNYKTQIINIEELYEQFAYGIDKHPLSIKNFTNYILENWTEKPKHILLLGKAVRYNQARYNLVSKDQCLVPTYGAPGSDFDLVSTSVNSPVNQISIGRLSALDTQDIKAYLDKLVEYEANLKYNCDEQNAPSWMSNILHLTNGQNEQETEDMEIISDNFLQQLNENRWKTENTLFQSNGVNVQPAGIEVYDIINNGIGLFNYYGYSNGEYWKFNIPTDGLNNKGKYPIILSNTSYTGDIFKTYNETYQIHSRDMIFTENKGAIAYYGGKMFGIFQIMEDYNLKLYKNFSNKDYGKTLGEIIQNVNAELYDENNPVSQFYSDLYTYHGDPAIRFAHHPKPDFQASDETITLSPSEISSINEPIILNLSIVNPGRYQSETLQVDIEKIDEEGVSTFVESIDISIESDSANLNYTFPPNTFSYGESTISISINADKTIAEYCYENNLAFITLNIEEETSIEYINAKINIFPNPVSENLNITADNITKIELHSLDGKKIKEWKFQNQSNANINIADISTGNYLLKIESNSKIISRKITVN